MVEKTSLVASAGHYHLGHRRSAWIAHKKGWFAEEGLEVEIIATGFDERTQAGLLEGRIDAGLDLRTDKILWARAKGDDFYIIGGFRNNFPKRLIAAKGITSVADLRGKRVAVGEPGGIEARHLHNLMVANGLEPGRDVTLVAVGKEPYKIEAMLKGTVDAAGLGEGADELAAEGYVELADFNDFYPNGFQERVLVVTGKTARERPDALKAFMKGMIRGNRFTMDIRNGQRVNELTYALLESDRLRGGEWAAEAERDWPSCQKEDHTRFPVPVHGGISWEGLLLAMQEEKAAGKIPADMRAEDVVRLDFAAAAQEEVDARFGPGGYE